MSLQQTQMVALWLMVAMLFLCPARENSMIRVLRCLNTDEAQDFLDGTRRSGKTLPHAQRWFQTTGRNLSSAQFKSAFRCRKPTFYELVPRLYGTTNMCRMGGRGPLFDPCERVAVFLWRLGGDCTVRQTSLQFGLSEGTVSEVTLEVAKLVEKKLRREYVTWPSPDEQREIYTEWEKEKGLRKVIGAIDGSHIRCLAPPEAQKLAYYNYKGYYSIVLLAIVDNEGLFRWFCSGAPGSRGDSGIFQDTTLYDMAKEEEAEPAGSRHVFANGACILGDSAFSESPWVRTPIPKPKTRAERFYNWKHSSQRFRVEHGYGRLKSKFRGLLKGLDCRLSHCATIVNACVVLYNFIFLHEGDSPADTAVNPNPTKNGTGSVYAEGAGPAGSKRAREVDFLARNYMQTEWGSPGSRADRARRETEKRMRRNNGT